jgi:hypothetical protein
MANRDYSGDSPRNLPFKVSTSEGPPSGFRLPRLAAIRDRALPHSFCLH